MSPTAHAVSMLVVASLVLAAVAVGCSERPSFRRVVSSLLAVLVGLLVVPPCFGHMCHEGDPGPQVLLWAAGAALLSTCISRRDVSGAALVLLSGVMTLICRDYTKIVHRGDLTGNPRVASDHARRQSAVLARSIDELRRAGKDDPRSHAADWLLEARDLPPAVTRELRDFTPERMVRVETQPFWHSSFTGLWAKREVPVALWYPGGPMAEAAPKLEWRDRPENRPAD